MYSGSDNRQERFEKIGQILYTQPFTLPMATPSTM